MSSFVNEADLDNDQPDPVSDPSTMVAEPEPAPGGLVPVDALVAEHVGGAHGLAIIPPETEMRALVQLAVTLSAAQLVPKALRDKPNDTLLVLLTARDLGIALTTALRLCHPIDGQVSVAPKLKLAMVRDRKLGRVWPDPENGPHQATWYAVRADDPDNLFASTFTWDDAIRVGGLVNRGCLSPDEHTDGCIKGQAKYGNERGAACKSNWYSYPQRMVSARSLGYLMDDAFGEVGSGLYSPDELGAITDEDGNMVVDVASEVGALEGTAEPQSMQQARRRQQRAAEGPPPGEELAPEADRELLARMMRALPDDGIAVGTQLWGSAVGAKIADLSVKRVKSARALIDSLWARARRGEWGDGWEPGFDPDAPAAPEPADGAEALAGPDAAPEAPEAHADADSGQSGDADPQPPGNEPAFGDIDAVIDHVAAMAIEDVDTQIGFLQLVLEGDREADRRRVLAMHLARAAHLLPQ